MLDANDFLKDIQEFFAKNFSDFIAVEPNNRTVRYLFYKNFKKFGLSIIVLTPVRIGKDKKLEFIPNSYMKIGTELRITKTKRVIIPLIGTEIHLGSDWEKILKEKIDILIKVISQIKQCDDCGNFMLPRVGKQKKTNTHFVSIRCRKCNKYKNLTYGVRIKQKLHRFIQKMET